MLIARACPIMRVYTKHGGQHGYQGHVLNLPQDLQRFVDQLPRSPSSLPVIIVRKPGADSTHIDLTVRRHVVLRALQWLKQNNPLYRDIIIDHTYIESLPSNGVPLDLQTFEYTPQNEDTLEIQDSSSNSADSNPFLPLPQKSPTEDSVIRHIVNDTDPLDWPDIIGEPLNEFKTG